YHSFKTTNEASSKYIEYLFETKKPNKELRKLITSGARMDGLLNINYDDFMGIKITIPKIKEQKKIGSLFKQIDGTITLQQQ
ncbi:restriction endonuclease subunit S, partial [Enterococcus faecium]